MGKVVSQLKNQDMEIEVRRTEFYKECTHGELFIDGSKLCDTLEDRDRDYNKDGDITDPGEGKVYGQTAIPRGRYKLIFRMSKRFGKVLPALLDVPGFEGILIHSGNTPEDTSGCILLGRKRKRGVILSSRYWMMRFMEIVKPVFDKSEEINVTVK